MIILKILCTVFIFGLIIFGHESGHFLAARLCGVTVNEFSFGMGPRLLSFQGKSTRFSIKLLPLGGSCEMKGESEDSSGDEDCFINKRPWQRLVIVAAGPCFNFIISFLVAAVLVCSLGSDRPVAESVRDDFPAWQAGIRDGDEIIRINSRNIKLFREISLYNMIHQGEELNVTVRRDDGEHTYRLLPRYDGESGRYLLGINGSSEESFPAGFFDTLKYSYYEVRYNFLMALDSLKYILSGHFGRDSVMGPVGMVGVVTDTVEEAAPRGIKILLLTLCDYILLFGTNLGIMNLLPLPALDGGRIVFILFEMIFRKPVKREIENYIHIAGLAALMLLMLYISFNDVMRLML